ncbi:MAG: GNAT family N-acetyltransferase [Xanthomonadales bacterium]|nr:GNAT family N-acetyltransferase [Xanthomonadales bacterium]
MDLRPAELDHPAVQALIGVHLAAMHANSPPGHVFALDDSGLRQADVSVWSAWHDDALLGIGALRGLDAHAGEVKSMRTHPDHLRKGVARVILEHLVAVARSRGWHRLSLETGCGPAFEPALALYRARGFVDGDAFGSYRTNAFSRFLHLTLAP